MRYLNLQFLKIPNIREKILHKNFLEKIDMKIVSVIIRIMTHFDRVLVNMNHLLL